MLIIKRNHLNKEKFISHYSTVKYPFAFPDDKIYNNKLILSVHKYAPYDFIMNSNMSLNEFSLDYRAELYDKFTIIYKKFIQEGHHVVIGEMGVVNKNNTQARVNLGRYYIEICRKIPIFSFYLG